MIELCPANVTSSEYENIESPKIWQFLVKHLLGITEWALLAV